ncbi:MAG TPA: hypothetical protein VHR86_00100, partial [Armatimonadota bacterium]|nr:hypothetical protein [Armatimonadota bacterium]
MVTAVLVLYFITALPLAVVAYCIAWRRGQARLRVWEWLLAPVPLAIFVMLSFSCHACKSLTNLFELPLYGIIGGLALFPRAF